MTLPARIIRDAGLVLMCVALRALLGAAPALPTTAPSTQPQSVLRVWFDQLADRDPDVREQARLNLMGISRRQLPELARIVKESRPLRPSQISELHDIVTHVYLAGEPYQRVEPEIGFLGLSWAPGETNQWDQPRGLVVDKRIKGFCAYRYLRDGDVIIGIRELPGREFNDTSDLTKALMEFHGGDRVTLVILRAGRVMPLTFKLDTRPDWPGPTIDPIQAPREKKAEQYWDDTFAELVGNTVTSARP